ncbi:MAG TPA: ABC transporter permease [Syntrophothermus lipocalidus]|nr:ABC transporter permease [Syntrophothermus lipocalidus]
MTSRAFLFNRGLVASDLKRFWWVSAAYGLCLLLILPFHHVIQGVQADDLWVKQALQRSLDIFSGQSGMQAILIWTVPVVLAVLLFRYLHDSRAVAVMHSLPLNRNTLFCSHAAAGLVLILLPVLITGFVLMILNATTELKELYSLLDILRWAGLTALFAALMFSITVFVGMFTGNTFAHVAFTYILQLLPTGLVILLDGNLRNLVYGYAGTGLPGEFRYNFPLVMLAGYHGNDFFTAGTAIAYLTAAAFFLAVAGYVYRLRPSEAAGEVVAFSVIRPVFKYGVTFCTMLLAGLYFASVYGDNYPLIVFGYVFGSLLGYLTAEILLRKSWQVWSAYRGFVAYAVVITVLLVGIATDVTGYVHRVPDPEKVKKVYFGTNINEWIQLEKRKNSQLLGIKYEGVNFFQDKENIRNIVLLHRQLLETPHSKEGTIRYIAYTLDNGDYLIRQYYVDEKRHASILKPIYESLEYKKARFPVVTQDPDNIKLVEIKDIRTSKGPVILTQKPEIKEFVARLKQDILNTTFEDLVSDREDNVYINIVDIKGNSVEYALREGYRSVTAWLKNKGYYEDIVLFPEEVDRVILERTLFPEESKSDEPNRRAKRVEVTDRKLIEELLTINGPQTFASPERIIRATFYGRTNGRAFQFERVIDRDWPVSKSLGECLKQLD